MELIKKLAALSAIMPPGFKEMIKKWNEIGHDCEVLSRNSVHSKEEIMHMVTNHAQTTPMNFEQAFYFIKGRLSND